MQINSCRHVFTPNLLKEWFQSSVYCPICRSDIRCNDTTTNTNTNTTNTNSNINSNINNNTVRTNNTNTNTNINTNTNNSNSTFVNDVIARTILNAFNTRFDGSNNLVFEFDLN